MEEKIKTISLTRRLIVRLSLAIGLVSIIASVIFAWYTARTGKLDLEGEADETTASLCRILEKPMWDFDVERVAAIGESFKSNSDISSLTCLGAAGEKLYAFQREGIDESIQRHGMVQHKDRNIGQVDVVFSSAGYYDDVKRVIEATALTDVLILATVFLLTGYLVRVQIRLPLDRLSTVLRTYAGGTEFPRGEHIPYREFQGFGAVLYEMGQRISSQLQELRALNADLQQNQERLKGIADSVPGVIYQFYARKSGAVGFHFISRRCEDILGLDSTHEGFFERFMACVPDEERPAMQASIQRVVEQLCPWEYEGRFIRPDGKELFIRGISHPAEADDEVVFSGVLLDVTEQKRAQALLLESEKLRTVAGLASGVAHEINNPLAGMVQNAQVVINRLSQDTPANRVAAERHGTTLEAIGRYVNEREILASLEAIRASGRQASRTVQNLLAYSRRDARMSSIDPKELVERSLELAGSDYEISKSKSFAAVEIVRQFADDTPLVYCQPGLIHQVLLNLIRNAVQAMRDNPPERRPRLLLRTFARNGWGCIAIEDNGPGIAPEIRRRMFEPFFTTKGEGAGTGLGLFVSYHILTVNHRGSIEFESTAGFGTCFVITLPTDAPAPAKQPASITGT